MTIAAVGTPVAPLCIGPFYPVATNPAFLLLSLTLHFKGISPLLMCYVSSLFVSVERLLLSV